jgi:uncharacterized membrane protein (DUF485 family)
MNLRHAFASSFGLFCTLLAVSMFFRFPGVAAWAFSALPSAAVMPDASINLLLVFLVVMPAVLGPLVFILRARRFEKAKLGLGSIALAGLFLVAGLSSPALCGRVALVALLCGQLLALGIKAKESVPFNCMIFLGFLDANLNFPDADILPGVDFLACAYLLCAGALVLKGAWKPESNRRSRVMVG